MYLKRKRVVYVIACLLCLFLSLTASAADDKPKGISANLSAYSDITIKNLSDGTEKSLLPRYLKKRFPQELARNLTASGVFSDVRRRANANSGVIVDGRVLKYTQATQRTLGVASSQFEILIKLFDAESGELLDSFVINRDSHGVVGAKFKRNQERVETYIDEVLHELTVNLITAKLGKTSEPITQTR